MSERSPLLASSNSAQTNDVNQAEVNNDDDDHHQHAHEEHRLSPLRAWIIGVSLFILIFVLTFGVSVISTIQSPVARDLHITSGASWLTSSYLISVTSVTPVSGKICKIFSLRSYLLVSTVIQAAGLFITAFSQSFGIFLLGRIVCGIGAAAVTPVAFISVTEFTPSKHWGFLFGVINCGYTTGVAVGAVAGGAFEPLIGWRACFWAQGPLCVVIGMVAFFAMPPVSASEPDNEIDSLPLLRKVARIDYLGVVTLIGAVVLLLYTASSTTFHIAPLILAILLLGIFCLVEARVAVEPIIPMSVLASRPMLLTGLATVGLMCARWIILFYIPTYGIAVRCWGSAKSGLLLVPTNLGFGIGSVVVGVLHIKKSASYYKSCIFCFFLFALEHFAMSRLITPSSPIWLFITALFFNGFIAGATLNYNLAHLLYLTKAADHAIVIPLNAMFRSLSGSIGSAISGGIFTRSLQDLLTRGFASKGLTGEEGLIAQLLSRPALVNQLHGVEKDVAVVSYAASMQYLISVSCIWVLAMLFLQAGTGRTPPKKEDESTLKRRVSVGSTSLSARDPLVS